MIILTKNDYMKIAPHRMCIDQARVYMSTDSSMSQTGWAISAGPQEPGSRQMTHCRAITGPLQGHSALHYDLNGHLHRLAD